MLRWKLNCNRLKKECEVRNWRLWADNSVKKCGCEKKEKEMEQQLEKMNGIFSLPPSLPPSLPSFSSLSLSFFLMEQKS